MTSPVTAVVAVAALVTPWLAAPVAGGETLRQSPPLAVIAASAPRAQEVSGGPAASAEVTQSEEQVAELIRQYLRTTTPAAGSTQRPAFGWAAGLWSDHRARRVNDLLTVRVMEDIVGSGSADSAVTKSSSMSAALPNFFGLAGRLPSAIDPRNLVNGSNDSDFSGGGSTTRAGTLRAVVTARVADVLPNGTLVLQGLREIEINGDRQVMVLTGLVRPQDVSPNNVVLSPAIGQFQIRYFGTGLMKDTLKPGWLTRIFNKIF